VRKQRQEERKRLITFTPVYDLRRNVLLGYLGDLTLQGAMIVGEKPMEVDKSILLAIDFRETAEFSAIRMTIPVRVAWCRQDKTSKDFNTGVEFQEISDQDKRVIEAILERYQFRREVNP
jgi:hypothetical protein